MPQFAMILYTPTPGDWESAPPEEMEAHETYAAKVDEIGVKPVTGYALHPSTQGKSVSRDGGVKDGAFVDGPYVIGGFAVLEANDIDHAMEMAKHNPATWRGGVEIRPLMGE
ncbi:YciI family protein [Planomonospora corallina]|uniref:YciI family protein n=1 Tax=Planomonospora corallina TaxID=1806052 RepID=A0ABV8I5G4_9ACTN